MSQVVTARVDAETATKLDRLAEKYERTRSWMVARAIKRYADEGCAYLDFVQEGIDAVARGEVVSHEEVESEFADLVARRKSAA